MSTEEHHLHRKQIKGMSLALKHAIDMNHNGQLELKELEEFRRFLIGHTLDSQPMSEHIKQRESGEYEKLSELAGTDHDDERDGHEVSKDRAKIAQKIISSYVTELWIAGDIDDETYMVEMQRCGMVPDHVREAREDMPDSGEDPSAGDEALATWGSQFDTPPPEGFRNWAAALADAKRKLKAGKISEEEFAEIAQQASAAAQPEEAPVADEGFEVSDEEAKEIVARSGSKRRR